MKKSNEFTPREMKKLLMHMVSIKGILTSNGYSVPETGNMECPFHDNINTPAAKYYSASNCIYCFTDHEIYGPADALELCGIDYKEIFIQLWDSYTAKKKDDLIQKLDQVYETKLLFKDALTQFKMGLITYPQLCNDIVEKLNAHLPVLQLLYNISREINAAPINSDDYTWLTCAANLNNIKQITSGEILDHQDKFKYYKFIPNFIKAHEDVLLIFNMYKNIPVGCTMRSKKDHAFADIGNTGGLFYGLCNLKRDFKYGDPIVIVEGPKDCETYRHVFDDKNCIAIMTSNLTSAQQEVIKCLTNDIVLANDNDEAGIKAQKEFLKYNKKNFKINILKHPDDIKDFGDLITLSRNDKQQFRTLVNLYKIQMNNFI
jgi:5S rRNA maturation endonuclease (ribonuclease M5)